MTVRELIAILEQMPQDAEVWVDRGSLGPDLLLNADWSGEDTVTLDVE